LVRPANRGLPTNAQVLLGFRGMMHSRYQGKASGVNCNPAFHQWFGKEISPTLNTSLIEGEGRWKRRRFPSAGWRLAKALLDFQPNPGTMDPLCGFVSHLPLPHHTLTGPCTTGGRLIMPSEDKQR
jgi:hypothetical protein